MKNQTNHTTQWGEEVFPLLSWFKMDKVKNAKVMVVGAGALGNEVLKNLALFGVGNIVVVDFDTIEYSNLTRSVLFRPEDANKGHSKAEVAAKRLMEINPTIHVQPICGDLSTDVGLGIYRRMDVVVGCLDSLRARILLNRLSFRAGKTWIDAGIGDLEGQVTAYRLHENCYECSLSDEEHFDTAGNNDHRASCPQIAQGNAERGRVATTPVSASIMGAVQAQEAMKMIHAEELENGVFTSLIGNMFHYEGKHTQTGVYQFSSYHNDECISHEVWENIVEIQELSADTTIEETLKIIRKKLQVDSVDINLRNDKFVDFLSSRSDNKKFITMLPESKIPNFIDSSKELEFLAIKDGGLFQHAYENIDDMFPYQNLSLKQIGIPYLDVLQVTTEKGYAYLELSADKNRFKITANTIK